MSGESTAPLGALATQVRALADATVDRDIGDDVAARASVALQQALDLLDGAEPRPRDITSMAATVTPVDGAAAHHFDHCLVCGTHNGAGLAVQPRWVDGALVADVVLGHAHEGAPGIAHGGVVSLLFDDLLAYPAAARAGFVVTTDLWVKYLAPTPVGVPLAFEARCSLEAGDRYLVSGSLRAGESTTATATGWFRAGDRRLLA